MSADQTSRIRDYYRQRDAHPPVVYDPLSPWVARTVRERDLAMLRTMRAAGMEDLSCRTALEVGCGGGGNLLFLLRLGFLPEHLYGNDIVPERIAVAQKRLPGAVRLFTGSAENLALESGSLDMVLQCLMFSSLLDADLTARVGSEVWRILKPGGGVLWYDLRFDNPRNPNVRGIRLSEIRRLFPDARIQSWSVTLAPPISRTVCRLAPWLYEIFNLLPILRSHLVCWIAKPGGNA
jgi:SAM-dependent methyltransferase